MKRIKQCALFSILLFLFACNDSVSIEEAVTKLHGKQIEINWSDMVVPNSSDNDLQKSFLERHLKIVVPFEEDKCNQCLIKHLLACVHYMKSMPKDSVAYVCIIPAHRDDILSAVKGIDLSDLCIISDIDNNYSKTNRIEDYNSFFRTYLLDKDNRVVLVGDPLRSTDLQKLYTEKIRELIANGGELPKKKSLLKKR